MKVILENKITAVTASSEDSSFPDDNVLDEHPKRVWKGNSVSSATMTCSVSANASAVAIFNTNAQSVSIAITDPNLITWDGVDWANITWPTTAIIPTVELAAQAENSSLWGTFPQTTVATEMVISFSTASGTTIQAGVIVVGDVTMVKDPQYGMTQGLVDYSVIAQLANGATYYNKKDIVRTFGGTILPERDTAFYTFMHSVSRTYGQTPLAWRVTDQDNFEWVVYARLQNMPQGSHVAPNHSQINFSLIEVL